MRLAVGQDPFEESLAGIGWVGEDLGTPGASATAGATAGAGASAGGRPIDTRVDDWLPDDEVEAAVHVGVPLVPVMVHGPRPWSPWARVVVGDPVPTRTRRSARSLAEVAASVATSFADLA